jgi:sugar phosphate isomerase/epimerase
MKSLLVSLVLVAAGVPCWAADTTVFPGPFYAMDTAFQRPGLAHAQQLELVRELGYAGIAWHEQPVDDLKPVLNDCDRLGLKMFAIYCPAQVTPGGEISWSPRMPELLKFLKGRETIIWLHIGGKGPAFDAELAQRPVVKRLRGLAKDATAQGLKVAIYPHLGEWTARFGDATALADAVDEPGLGVSFNLCHCLAMGDEQKIPQLLTAARKRLLIVQINGADSGVSGGQWKRLIQTLDKGTYDWGIVMKTLREIGFAGPVGFQGYGISADARSILVPTMAAWKKQAR